MSRGTIVVVNGIKSDGYSSRRNSRLIKHSKRRDTPKNNKE